MFDSESEARLRRMFNAPGAVRPSGGQELEGRLLAKFDELYPKKEKYRMKSIVVRRALLASAAALALGVVAACTAPADLDVDVGRSIEIRYDKAPGSPDAQQIVEFLQGKEHAEGEMKRVSVHARGDGTTVAIQAEVWDTGAGPEPLSQK